MSGEIAGYVVMVVMGILLFRQQLTIDHLTNKLMARNYVEYKSMDRIKEDDASPLKEDEPVSWHDYN